MQNKNNKKRICLTQYSGGFTIIETMVALSVFLIVVTIGMSALLNSSLIHQKSQDMRSIMDNLSFIVEDMSRSLRTGSEYHCITENNHLGSISGVKDGNGCDGIAFKSSGNGNKMWIYYIDKTSTPIKIWKSADWPNDELVQLTPDEVSIDSASSFDIFGTAGLPGDMKQPFVTIRLSGKITYKNVDTAFSLQTSVSQRSIDR